MTRLRMGTMAAIVTVAVGSTACLPLPPPPWRAHDRSERAERRDRWERDGDYGHRDRHERRERYERMRWQRR
jgi:hypothetical protein